MRESWNCSDFVPEISYSLVNTWFIGVFQTWTDSRFVEFRRVIDRVSIVYLRSRWARKCTLQSRFVFWMRSLWYPEISWFVNVAWSIWKTRQQAIFGGTAPQWARAWVLYCLSRSWVFCLCRLWLWLARWCRDNLFFCNIQRQNPNLIADDIGLLSVHWLRISALKLGIAFGPGHKECLALMNLVKPCKIQVSAVHQIKDSSLDDELIQDVDFVGLSVCNVNETGYISMQIQKGVLLHRSLGCAKRNPRINRQAEVYRRRVEGINTRIQNERQGL